MKNRPTRLQIAKGVCDYMEVTYLGRYGVKSSKRARQLVAARAVIVHIGKLYDYSYPEISSYAGYSSHSGAHDARRKLLAGHYGDDLDSQSRKIMAKLDNR